MALFRACCNRVYGCKWRHFVLAVIEFLCFYASQQNCSPSWILFPSTLPSAPTHQPQLVLSSTAGHCNQSQVAFTIYRQGTTVRKGANHPSLYRLQLFKLLLSSRRLDLGPLRFLVFDIWFCLYWVGFPVVDFCCPLCVIGVCGSCGLLGRESSKSLPGVMTGVPG